jgi:MFS family permease
MNTLAIELDKRTQLYPILMIGLCLLLPFYKYVLQIFPSVITDQLMNSFHLTGAGLGNLAATFYYAYLVTQFAVGVILDKYNIKYVISITMLICAIGTYGFCFSHKTFEACFFRALMGAGVAFAPIAYMKITAICCSPQRYAFVNGLLATASMLGAVFGESVLSYFVDIVGWRTSLFYIALFGVSLSVIYLISIKRVPNQRNGTQCLSRADLIAIFSNKQNWLLFLYGGFAFSPAAIFGGLWGNPFLQQAYHVNKSEAASMISLIFMGLAIGSPLLGMMSDYIGKRKRFIVQGTIVSLLSLLIILYGKSLPLWCIQVSLFTFGFSLGAYMLVFTLGKEINPLAFTATVVAMINSSEAILDSIAEPLIGKLLDFTWRGTLLNGVPQFSLHQYQVALIILPIFSCAALLSLNWLRETGKA